MHLVECSPDGQPKVAGKASLYYNTGMPPEAGAAAPTSHEPGEGKIARTHVPHKPTCQQRPHVADSITNPRRIRDRITGSSTRSIDATQESDTQLKNQTHACMHHSWDAGNRQLPIWTKHGA